MSDTEEELQTAAYKFNQILTLHGLTTCAQKINLMLFKGRDPGRSKCVIDSKIIGVNSFNCLGDLISSEKDVHIDNKLSNLLKITGITNNRFRPQTSIKKTRMKLYYALALPVLLDGTGNWTITVRDVERITAAEVEYMRKTAGRTWTDYKTNTEITRQINKTHALDKIQEYRRNSLQHVNGMTCNRLPRISKKTTDQEAERINGDHKETSKCVRPEWVNKWPNCKLAR
jgi:hypothetical protein